MRHRSRVLNPRNLWRNKEWVKPCCAAGQVHVSIPAPALPHKGHMPILTIMEETVAQLCTSLALVQP